jgi:hypothetical protein
MTRAEAHHLDARTTVGGKVADRAASRATTIRTGNDGVARCAHETATGPDDIGPRGIGRCVRTRRARNPRRQVRVGRRVLHGAGYEASVPDAADYVAMIDFDDLAGLQTYLHHPAHQQLGARFGESLSAAMVYDFEVGGMDALRAGGLT